MSNEVADYLNTHGPQLSGEVAAALVKTQTISQAAARKRIERREAPVRALDLQFPRGAQFLYLESQYGSPQFWRNLAAALVKSNGAYARVIWALNARGGILPLAHFASAVGSSSGQRQLSGDVVFGRLVSVGLLQEIEVPGMGACVAFAKGESYIDDLLPAVRGRLIAETVLLQSIQEWAAKLGLGGFNSFKLRSGIVGDAPAVATFAWDLSAPSYLGPLANWASPDNLKPGFIVVDVLLTESIGVDDISPFLYKCASLRQLRGVGRCLQFFVARSYSPDALNLVRRAGIVPATPEALFGTEVARALVELANTLGQVGAHGVDPAKFTEIFERLGKAEAAAGTIRGALFEYVVAELVRTCTPDVDITMNKIYREGGKDVAEVDVRVIVKNRAARFIECKGLLPGHYLGDREVESWLNKRIPIVRRHTIKNPEYSKLKLQFELWVTGELTATAKKMISDAQDNVSPNKYSIEVIDAAAVAKMVNDAGDSSLYKIVNQHFLHAPLAFPDDVVNPWRKQLNPQNSFTILKWTPIPGQ